MQEVADLLLQSPASSESGNLYPDGPLLESPGHLESNSLRPQFPSAGVLAELLTQYMPAVPHCWSYFLQFLSHLVFLGPYSTACHRADPGLKRTLQSKGLLLAWILAPMFP